MRLRGALTATALAGALLLTACAADPPTASVPPSASPSASGAPATMASETPEPPSEPSPSPSTADVSQEPTPPEALKGPANTDNAIAVAEYFMALFPYAFATGDTTAWDRLSGDDCGYCDDITRGVAQDHAKGWHDVGGNMEILNSHATDFDDGSFYVTLVIDEHGSTKLDGSGAVVKEFPGTETLRAQIYLVWSGDQWLIDGVDVDPVEG